LFENLAIGEIQHFCKRLQNERKKKKEPRKKKRKHKRIFINNFLDAKELNPNSKQYQINLHQNTRYYFSWAEKKWLKAR